MKQFELVRPFEGRAVVLQPTDVLSFGSSEVMASEFLKNDDGLCRDMRLENGSVITYVVNNGALKILSWLVGPPTNSVLLTKIVNPTEQP